MSRPSEHTIPTPVSEYPSGKALSIHERLVSEYGPRLSRGRILDPLSELIFTILSQNTSDVNRDRACESLRSRFPTWEEVLQADVADIEDAIRIGGLAAIKAPRIKNILEHIHREQSTLSLDFLRNMPVPEARKWLHPGRPARRRECTLLGWPRPWWSRGRPEAPCRRRGCAVRSVVPPRRTVPGRQSDG